jgi:hypothetical protein
MRSMKRIGEEYLKGGVKPPSCRRSRCRRGVRRDDALVRRSSAKEKGERRKEKGE